MELRNKFYLINFESFIEDEILGEGEKVIKIILRVVHSQSS